MKKITIVLLMALAISTFSFGGNELVEKLTSKLGVTQEQASGGSGAIFSALKDGLKKDEFAKIKDSVPGIGDLIKSAPESKSELSGLSSMMGKDAKKLAILAKTKKAFKKLGLDEDKFSEYLPVIIEYVKEKGGDKVAGLIDKVF